MVSSDLLEAAASLGAVRVAAGAVFVEQGDPSVLVLLKGAIKLERSPIVLDVLRAPAIVSTLGAASAIALRASSGVVIDAGRTAEVPGLVRAVDVATADFLRATVRCIDALVIGSAEERLLRVLSHLAERYGTPIGKATFIALPLRRRDLARMVGITLESASRVLARLEREGKLRTKREGLWLSK